MKQLKSELAKISESTFFISTKSGAPNERRKQSVKKGRKVEHIFTSSEPKKIGFKKYFSCHKNGTCRSFLLRESSQREIFQDQRWLLIHDHLPLASLK